MPNTPSLSKYLVAIGLCVSLLCIGGVSAHVPNSGSIDVKASWSPTWSQFFWWWPSSYLTDESTGTTIDISKNSWFVIQLPENPTTGYQWDITPSSGLDIFYSDYKDDDNPDGFVGVGGTHVWFVKAKDSGDHTISCVNKRSGESVATNDTQYLFKIRIT